MPRKSAASLTVRGPVTGPSVLRCRADAPPAVTSKDALSDWKPTTQRNPTRNLFEVAGTKTLDRIWTPP